MDINEGELVISWALPESGERDRAKKKCVHRTAPHHENLIENLIKLALRMALGQTNSGWTISCPTLRGISEKMPMPSAYPKTGGNNKNKKVTLAEVREIIKAAYDEELSDTEAEDIIDGHCELVCALIGKYALKHLARSELYVCKKFKKEYKNGRRDFLETLLSSYCKDGQWVGAWKHICPNGVFTGKETNKDMLKKIAAGIVRVDQYAEHIKKGLQSGKKQFILPLYAFNYVYADNEADENELQTASQAANGKIESATYDSHCIVLLFDSERKRLDLLDPNGPIIHGGNYEFLQIPFTRSRTSQTSIVRDRNDYRMYDSADFTIDD